MQSRPDLMAAIDWLAESALDEKLETQRRITALEAEIDALRYQNATLREALHALALPATDIEKAPDLKRVGCA